MINYNIEKYVKELKRRAKKIIPPQAKYYNIQVTYWDDEDFRIVLQYAWGKLYKFQYKYSIGKYFYNVEENNYDSTLKELLP